MIGYDEKGILCGTITKDVVHNMNDEYKEYLIPKKEEFTPIFAFQGNLTKEQIDGILNAKKQAYNFEYGIYSLFLINRMLFFSDKSLKKEIGFEIYDIEEDSNLFKIVFYYEGKIGNNKIDISQSFIGYRK